MNALTADSAIYSNNQPVDAISAWIASNRTGYCKRMQATITAAACIANQKQSFMDCRCTGCGGLDNQPEAFKLSIESPKLPQQEDNSRTDTETSFEDIELDLDDEQLLKLFPELLCQKDDEDHEGIIEKHFAEYQEPVKPRMFYSGTCERCGGYMEDTRERFDDNVFRCLICGWRTSPEYEVNRIMQRKGNITL